MAARAFTAALLLLSSSSTLAAAILEPRAATPTCTITLVTPAPARFRCEEKDYGTYAITTKVQNTFALCRDSCVSNTACVSFAYTSSKQRTLYTAKLNDVGFKASITGPISSNRGCYVCKCGTGLTKCVDLQNSSSNCGACGKQCASGTSCVNGACSCPVGTTLCNGACVNTSTSSSNCGSCGNTCGTGASCNSGSCSCSTGSALCSGPNGPCQDLQSDKNNCGSCGTACEDDSVCQSGSCVCPANTLLAGGPACKGSCSTNYNTNQNNCGSCANACTALGTSCQSGSCKCSDASQQVCSGACVNVQNDPCNCGSCGNACGSSSVCKNGECSTGIPPVVLTNPTPITYVSGGTSDYDYDDDVFDVNLPFQVSFFGTNTTKLYMSVNGWLSLSSLIGGFSNKMLPSDYVPDTTLCPLWDDLRIYEETPQGLYYQITGTAPARTVAFEWYTSNFASPTRYYHFILDLYEAQPSTTAFKYYQVSDSGAGSTVGVQKLSTNMFSQYSFNEQKITPGSILAYDPSTNKFNAKGGCSA